jgi:predicted Zn-dependent peptidase
MPPLPSPSYPITRATLDNGLRVVLAPDPTAAVVGVAVYYDVGIRSEPEGLTGFAHLFEHLMFQGSANVGKTEHFTLIQAAGGAVNGSTNLDYTNYFEALPAGALELALYLEADRMRSVALTQENLDNQVAVVSEEIRVNVLNRPYGGFPWILLPPVLFSTFPNAHNGYGAFEELESATLADAEAFFARYYAPSNAVLTLAGDLEVGAALALVERHFGDLPARAAPARPSFAEPPPPAERREVVTDRLAPRPAVAVGYRVPDPLGPLEEYLPYVVLAEVLSDGDASRLERRLVQRDGLVTDVSADVGVMGGALDVRDPTAFVVEARHPATVGADAVLSALDEELDRLATDGLEPGELERVRARWAARYLRGVDPVVGRAQLLSVLEQQRARPELLNELPRHIGDVTPDRVAKAAGALRPGQRAVLELRPGAAA